MVKKFIYYIWIIGMGLILAGNEAFSAPPNPEPWTENLNLTLEQSQTLKDLRSRFRQEMVQVQKKIMLLRLELRTSATEEIKGEKEDGIRRQIQSLLLQTRERSLFFQQEALNILTPEQRKQLPPDNDLGFRSGRWFPLGKGPGMRHGMGPGMGMGMKGPAHGPMNSD